MERELIYLLAISDIILGFFILHRGQDRFGLDTYRTFLNREERYRRETQNSRNSGFWKRILNLLCSKYV